MNGGVPPDSKCQGAGYPPEPDDGWVEWLSALDDQLAEKGEITAVPGAGDTPADEIPCDPKRLRQAAFVRLLAQIWPRLPYEAERWMGAAAVASCDESKREIGRFRIISELGRGGFGVVLLAEDPIIGRLVALKVPRPEVLITREFRERFQREARAQSLLNHPHIVPVLEAGEVGALSYVATAYFDSVNLREWLRTRTTAIPPRQAAAIARQLATALQHAHERGVLHRDLKPSNVLIEQISARNDDALGVVARLIDFGLAKVQSVADDLTGSRCQLGTPHYMAPEQAEGDSQRIGVATDVYGLGVLLFEMLCGRAPFAAQADVQVLRQIVEDDVPRPRRFRRAIPRDLEAICLKCLEKVPERRYRTATELADDLTRYLERLPIRARRVSSAGRLARWARRRPLPASLSGALVLLGVIASLLVAREWRQTRSALADVERERHRAEFRLKVSQDLLYRLVDELSAGSEFEGTPTTGSKLDQEIAGFLSELVDGIDPDRATSEEARAWNQLASIYLQRNDAARAQSFAERAVVACRRLERAPGGEVIFLELLRAEVILAAIVQRWGEQESALRMLYQARKLIERAPPSTDLNRLTYFKVAVERRTLRCAEALREFDDISGCVQRIDEALRVPVTGAERGVGRARTAASAYSSAARNFDMRGRRREAMACLDRARAALNYCETLEPRDVKIRLERASLARQSAQVNLRIGDYRSVVGDLRESLRLHRQLRQLYPVNSIYRASLDWPKLIAAYQTVGDTTAARWAIPEAIWEIEQALPLLDQTTTRIEKQAEVYSTLIWLEELLGRTARAQYWYKQATDTFARVSEIRELSVGERFAELQMWFHYGRGIADGPLRSKARERLIQCETRAAMLVAKAPTHVPARGYLARSRSWLGRICRDGRRLDEAEKWFALAAEEYRIVLREAPHEKGFATDLAMCEEFLASRKQGSVASRQ